MSGPLVDADFPLTVVGNVVFRSTSPVAMVTLPSVELAADIASRLNLGEHDRRDRIAALHKQDIKEEVLAAYDEEPPPPPLAEQFGRSDGWTVPMPMPARCVACNGIGIRRDLARLPGMGPLICVECEGTGNVPVCAPPPPPLDDTVNRS